MTHGEGTGEANASPPPTAAGAQDDPAVAPPGALTLDFALLDASLDAVVLMDRAGQIIAFNAAAEACFGYRRADAVGRRLADLLVPEALREAHSSSLSRYRSAQPSAIVGRRVELDAQRADGTLVPVELSVVEVSAEPVLFAGFLRDLTEPREQHARTQALLLAERTARAQAEAEVARRDRLGVITARLAEALTPHQVARAITEEGVAMLGAQAGSVVALDDTGQALDVVAAIGYDEATLARWTSIPLHHATPLTQAVREGRTLIAETREQVLERWPEIDPGPELGARVAVPLVVEGRALGAIGLTFASVRGLDPGERDLLDLVARQCAQALERARSYDREARARTLAEAAQERLEFLAEASAALDRSLDPAQTLENVAQLCVPRLGELSVIDLIAPDGRIRGAVAAAAADPEVGAALEHLRAQYPLNPDGEHPVARVLRHGRAELEAELSDATLRLIAESEEHLSFMRRVRYRSSTVAPLRARGRTLGVLSVLRLRDGMPYDRLDLQLLEEFALRAAMALDNAMLYAERERQESSARFLAESTQLLSRSLDHEQTLQAVAGLAVPQLADWCAVDVLEATGQLRRVALTNGRTTGDPGIERTLRQAHGRDLNRPEGVPHVLRTGRSEFHRQVTDELLVRLAQDEQHLTALRQLKPRSLIIVPMRARGRILGTISLASAESGRLLDEASLRLAEELGRRAGLAVDNARLYQQTSHIAVTLQQSLLPPELPQIPGLDLAARYRPTGAGNEVGGDFYDLFPLDDQTWAVVIGDVCGKGADAAALTALTRYTIRAVATAQTSPAEVLLALNQAILRQATDFRFCTAVYGRLSLDGDAPRLDLACAGHPPPLLQRRDGTEALELRGQLLGVRDEIRLPEATVTLHPGECIVLYTDGLTDAGAPQRMISTEQLLEIIGRSDGAAAETVVRELERAAVAHAPGGLRDDIAIVAMRVPPRDR